MIQAFKGWENVKAAGEYVPLPVGGYVAKIMDAKVIEYQGNGDSFSRLDVCLDIAEGEYKDYYANDYRNQNTGDKKWKGVLKLYLAKENGTEQDEWNKRVFRAFIDAVEESNHNYHWDWDETKLKGKMIGCIFRNEQWEFNGNTGWKAQPFKAVPVSKIRENDFTIPKDKPLKNKATGNTQQEIGQIEDIMNDDDLPF